MGFRPEPFMPCSKPIRLLGFRIFYDKLAGNFPRVHIRSFAFVNNPGTMAFLQFELVS